jgi:hypothetical protein
MQGAWCLCQILTGAVVSEQIFIKVSSIKFHENPSSGCRTFGHDEANSRFSRTRLKWLSSGGKTGVWYPVTVKCLCYR